MKFKLLAVCLFLLGVASAYAQEEMTVIVEEAQAQPAPVNLLEEKPALAEFGPQIESTVFVPKGQWVGGISVSYSQSTQNNYQFFVLEHLKGDTYSFRVSPMLCYIFKDDMGAGARFAYTRSLTKLETADIVLDSETEVNMENLYRLSHNYYATALFRNYISLNGSKRFGFFNEVQLQLGGGQSKLMQGKGSAITGNYERNFNLDVGIAPGLAIFLNNYSAVEVQIGVLGFSYHDTKTITDQIYVARRKSMAANFYLNLFSINFGVSFYL